MIRIENKRTYKGDGVYVGRPSPLGNPFSHVPSELAEFRVATREEAVDRYRDWLRKALETDPKVRKAFDELVEFYRCFGSLTLVCWCVPQSCHAEVIRDFILETLEGIDAGETCHEHQEQVEAVEAQSGSFNVTQ